MSEARKKPRKLDRSKPRVQNLQNASQGQASQEVQAPRKRPPKLEVREPKEDEGVGQTNAQTRKRPAKLKDKKAGQIPKPEQANEAVKAAETAKVASLAQQKAAHLKDRADQAKDPAEQRKLMSEAMESQKKALSENETVKMLSSGVIQGAGAGGGLGLATGAGVGTAVGGVVSVPTTALGAGVGAGVGALHGPFVKMSSEDDEQKH
ncbi:MAG: hypothetical protein Q9165_005704 [Trypethelium subeluteriae]